jgi:ribonuclease BN (tRNA processing enzyme)
MDLIVAGAGPAYSRRRGDVGAAYLVGSAGSWIVLDLGHGTFSGVAARVEPSSLAGVVISHLHPDHFVDLVPLRHYLRWEFDPPRRVRVIAPRDISSRLDGLHGEAGFCQASLDVEPLEDGIRDVGPFRLEARRVRHTDDSYAFRVSAADEGPGLVYSGDCGFGNDLAPLIRPGDALLAEVSYGPGPGVGSAAHLDGPTVGRLAASTRPGRVLLTHLLSHHDRVATVASVRRSFDGDAQLVEPGFATTL